VLRTKLGWSAGGREALSYPIEHKITLAEAPNANQLLPDGDASLDVRRALASSQTSADVLHYIFEQRCGSRSGYRARPAASPMALACIGTLCAFGACRLPEAAAA